VPVQIRTLCICGRPATVKTEHGRRCWTCLRKRLEKEARHYIEQFADDMRRGRIDE
jgi:predicted adenine nucleotide alpha hydrolase (AANH) superfamily ATPase